MSKFVDLILIKQKLNIDFDELHVFQLNPDIFNNKRFKFNLDKNFINCLYLIFPDRYQDVFRFEDIKFDFSMFYNLGNIFPSNEKFFVTYRMKKLLLNRFYLIPADYEISQIQSIPISNINETQFTGRKKQLTMFSASISEIQLDILKNMVKIRDAISKTEDFNEFVFRI